MACRRQKAPLSSSTKCANATSPTANDPDPVTEANLDVYRMADEWQIEFLGEGRRRTDLIRLGLYTTESWWAHKPTDDDTKKRFPLPL